MVRPASSSSGPTSSGIATAPARPIPNACWRAAEDFVLVIDVQGARQCASAASRQSVSSCCRLRSRCWSSGCAAAARTAEDAMRRRLRRAEGSRGRDRVRVRGRQRRARRAVDRLRAIVLAERARLRVRCGSRSHSHGYCFMAFVEGYREHVRVRRHRGGPRAAAARRCTPA